MATDTEEQLYVVTDRNGQPTGHRTVIRYDSKGRQIERLGYDRSGAPTYRQEVSYVDTQAGHENRLITYGPDGGVLSSEVGRFNGDGDLVEVLKFDGCGTTVDRQVYSYGTDAVTYERFGPDGALVETWRRDLQHP